MVLGNAHGFPIHNRVLAVVAILVIVDTVLKQIVPPLRIANGWDQEAALVVAAVLLEHVISVLPGAESQAHVGINKHSLDANQPVVVIMKRLIIPVESMMDIAAHTTLASVSLRRHVAVIQHVRLILSPAHVQL